jgi:hypothetical protein
MYGDNYGYRSSLNQSMVAHLRAKVEQLRARVGVNAGDLVIDIGSNDGTLLSFYPRGPALVGVDPTAAKFRRSYRPDITVFPDFFSTDLFSRRFGDKRAKIITSIAMFYDIERPLDFVTQIAELLDGDGVWHFEQSYLPAMLAQNAYDTICHEHLEYYGLKQIQWILDRGGLKILDVELNDVNGGSFAVTAARADTKRPANQDAIERILQTEEESRLDTLRPYDEFKVRVFEHREQLLRLMAKLASEKALLLGYGASTKGNVILQFCGITRSQIPFIAEVNEDKLGCFTPGTKIPIISEAEAHKMKPDYFVVLPWHFRENLVEREKAFLERGGRMLFPMPRVELFPSGPGFF